ncbi:hypothetical protein N2W54_002471 [Lotmaria passim]
MNVARRALICVALVALLLLCSSTTYPVNAFIYTTALTAGQQPGLYNGGGYPVAGLNTACVGSANPEASTSGRGALGVLSPSMTEMLAETVVSGQVYLSGFYNATESRWYWTDTGNEVHLVLFAIGAEATPVQDVVASNWSKGYPVLGVNNTVGARKYVAYDASLKGWINVDGTSLLDGVACQSNDQVVKKDNKFPWWGILIIVLGSVVIIAVVVTIVVCCCCCKKKKKPRYTDDEDESTFRSRSSFSSRSMSHAGTSRSSSFSSRGSSFSGSSKSSGVTGSTDEGSSSYMGSSSAASNSRDSSSQGTRTSGSQSSVSSSCGSSRI